MTRKAEASASELLLQAARECRSEDVTRLKKAATEAAGRAAVFAGQRQAIVGREKFWGLRQTTQPVVGPTAKRRVAFRRAQSD